jgi:tetratricopeptide (TPR) repeat protein/transcriptional regulator with XRE-family HTH domain
MGAREGGNFGHLLRHYRLAAGLTQEALADRSGLSVLTISALERGVNQAPRRETLGLLARALALRADQVTVFDAAARRRPHVGPTLPSVGTQSAASDADLPLAGRGRDLAALERHLQDHGPPLLVLAGEPGIGKSRLLREAIRRAADRGMTVLGGGCRQRGGQQPYAPLQDALADKVRQLPVAQARAVLRGCSWLVRLLPELAGGPIEPLPVEATTADQERRLMFGAVATLLSNLVGSAGTLLVLDDLQWAGTDALDLLRTLLPDAGRLHLRVLGAYRDTEVRPEDPLSVALADLGSAGLAAQRGLRPLASADASRLLDSLLVDWDAPESADRAAIRDRVLRRTGGVPFFLVSCAQALRLAAEEGGTPNDVPWDVAQGVRLRVGALPAPARETLDVAAIAGRVSSLEVLVAATGFAEATAVVALEAACDLRLLEETGAGTYQFAHDVIRDVVEADVSTTRRALLHRAVATAIEHHDAHRLAEQYETLAHHFTLAAVWDKALDYRVKAGDRAAEAYANGSALAHYAEALIAGERLGPAANLAIATAAQKRGLLNILLGNTGDAIADFNHMLAAAEALGDRRLQGIALARRGQCEMWHHEFDLAERSFQSALVVADSGLDNVRYTASVWLGGMYQALGRWSEGGPILAAAERLGAAAGNPFDRSWATLFLTSQLGWLARYDEALTILDRERQTTDRHPYMRIALGWTEVLDRGGKGEFQRAIDLLREVLTFCERVSEPLWHARALNLMGWLFAELQDHPSALAWSQRGVEAALALAAPDLEIESNARLNLADALVALGRPDEAVEQYRLVDPIVRHPGPKDLVSLIRYSQHHFHSYGEWWLLQGEPSRALADAAACLEIAEPAGHRKNVVKGRRLRAQALAALEQLVEAQAELESALAVARELGNPTQLWKTLAALGDLRTQQGEPVEARRAYCEAVAVIDGVASGLTEESLRETFLSSEAVQWIRRLAKNAG